MRYIPPFSMVRSSLELSQRGDTTYASVAYDRLLQILAAMIADIDVDEAWYLTRYQDVADAIATGKAASAKEHFINHGFFEGRQPYRMLIDEAWYLRKNPDVAESVRLGALASAQAHFDENGYNEGRLPFDPLG
jgi:hypothetical protein